MLLTINFFFCYLISDLISGIIHWLEDQYIKADSSLIGKYIGQPNQRHHQEPGYFLKHSYFQKIKSSAILVGILGLILWILKVRAWQVYLILLILSQANQIHTWAHQSFRQNGLVISSLQKIGLLQSTKHHALHHGRSSNQNYCTITNWLNPILEKLRFWRLLETILLKIFKIRTI